MNYEIIKCMSQDDIKIIRKTALLVLDFKANARNLEYIIQRTRDIEIDIRIELYKKFLKEKLSFKTLTPAHLFKILYDGLSSRNE